MELKICGPSSPGMLAMLLKHSLNLIWAEANNAVDLDYIDNAGLPPTRNGLDANAEKLSNLGGGEKLPLEVHCSPKMNLMLFLVSDCNLLILPLSRRDPHCLVLPTNLDISARLNRWYFTQLKRCSINSLSELLFIVYKI